LRALRRQIYPFNMNYDNYKLATPEYNDNVSSCCGDEITEYERYEEYCYNALICDSCGEECEQITYNEYSVNKAEYLAECYADEDKLNE